MRAGRAVGLRASGGAQGRADLGFHGKNDVVVPSWISERLIQKLRQLGANESEAKLTLYDAAPPPKGWPDYDGHGSPMPAYATPELWRWLLEQHL